MGNLSEQGERGQALNLGPTQGSEFVKHEEFANKSIEVFLDFIKDALPTLYTLVKNGEGKQQLEIVEGRPGEKRMVIDLTAYHLFTTAAEKHKNSLPYVIFSEEDQGKDRSLANGEEDTKDFVLFVIDPTENSSPYAKGVKGAGIFSVGTSFDQDGNPLAGFSIDIENAQVVMSMNGKNYLYTYEMVEKPNGNPRQKDYALKDPEGKPSSIGELHLSRKTTLNDPDASFYTFMGEKHWAESAIRGFLPKLLTKVDDKTHMELSRGGSHIYPNYLAAGRGEGYGIENEPVSEVFTSMAAAKNAGLIMRNYHKDGTWEEIEVKPRELVKNPALYTDGIIEFMVGATTSQVADEIGFSYVEAARENEENARKVQETEKELEELRAFRDSRFGEYILFERSRRQDSPPAAN